RSEPGGGTLARDTQGPRPETAHRAVVLPVEDSRHGFHRMSAATPGYQGMNVSLILARLDLAGRTRPPRGAHPIRSGRRGDGSQLLGEHEEALALRPRFGTRSLQSR